MSIQYISDNEGKTTGVYIPIKQWDKLKAKYRDIEKEEYDVPQWHIDIVRERLAEYKSNPKIAADFDEAMNEIEKDL